MNAQAVKSIFNFEMARFFRTWIQSVISPVLSTSLYFVVFGSAIGSRITELEGVSYGSFIVPGLIMLMILTQSVSNGSFGIYFPRFTGTIYELLSAPVSPMEIVLGYVGAAASKSLLLGAIVLVTAGFFVPIRIDHPLWMLFFLVATAVAFSLLGFIIGIVVKGIDQLQTVPLLIITPLTFLGGTFYALSVLPPFWQAVSLFNPIVYLVSGFRWSFYSVGDVDVAVSLLATLVFLAIELGIITWIFRTGYRIKT
jgi:ABC-2 type transport system permease protein